MLEPACRWVSVRMACTRPVQHMRDMKLRPTKHWIRHTRAASTGSTVSLLTWSDMIATARYIQRFWGTEGCIRRACHLLVGHGGGKRRAVSPDQAPPFTLEASQIEAYLEREGTAIQSRPQLYLLTALDIPLREQHRSIPLQWCKLGAAK